MPAVSKKQQKFMGIVRAIQKGEADPSDFNKDAQDAAKKMKKSSVKKYAKTKHKGLPTKKVKESEVKTIYNLLQRFGNSEKDAKNMLKKNYKKVNKKFKGQTARDKAMAIIGLSLLGEATKRDYKAEYKKFQSSTKAKKYRAELNKYNRQKGTYGNGDGKDASHKGGKIVGFEAESKNRGRAEKSRLKKEINDYIAPIIDETIDNLYENPAAIAAAQRMVVQSKGKKVSVNTARNSRYKDKDPAAHKKAKSIFQRIADKFKKKKVKEAMSPKVKRMMINAINDEAAMDDFLKKYGKYIPKSQNKSIMRYRDDIRDAEMGYGDDRVAKKYLIKIFMKYINEGTCGYGVDGELGEEPAGPHLLKKKKNESINEAGMELKKLEDAIKMFQKKIKKQGMVTNARDEEHLERLMKVYNDMGGRKIKENSESVNWLYEKCWKGYEKKGMKTMFGKRYPNCVKKKK